MMTNDFVLAVHLETVDLNDSPITKVEVGDTFKLRLSVEELNQGAYSKLPGGYADITFDASLG